MTTDLEPIFRTDDIPRIAPFVIVPAHRLLRSDESSAGQSGGAPEEQRDALAERLRRFWKVLSEVRCLQPDQARAAMPASTPENPPIEREEASSKGRYVLGFDGAEAEMTYSRAGETMIIIDHTEVTGAMRGRSVGQALVRRAVEDARKEGRSIIPLCPFAKAQISHHPEWQDVLAR
jgi:uncharacterized protein